MDNKMKLINLSNIECWQVNLLPFDDDHRWDSSVLPFQLKCIENNIFGIGWNTTSKDYGEMNDCSIQAYLSDYYDGNSIESSHKNAIDRIKEIKSGHYVIMRLRNSHFYIGKVDQSAKYNNGVDESGTLSWYCHVEQWIEFENEEALPSEIVGRFSQSLQATIVRISNTRQKLFMIQSYVAKTGKEDSRIGSIPKALLSLNNFNRGLNYKELEDLVCAHIYRLNPGYMLFPSSCKVNHPKFEFTFVKEDSKPITCQVKNQSELPPLTDYIDETSYDKIYLYSGLLNDAQVEQLKTMAANYQHIVYIKPNELFDTLCRFSYFLNKMDAYYTLTGTQTDVVERLLTSGWQKVKAFRGCSNMKFKTYDDGCVSIGSDNLFYHPDFNALVLKNDVEVSLEYCETVQKILSN